MMFKFTSVAVLMLILGVTMAQAQSITDAPSITPAQPFRWGLKLFGERVNEFFTFNKAKLVELKAQHLEERQKELAVLEKEDRNDILIRDARERVKLRVEEVNVLLDKNPDVVTAQNVESLNRVLLKLNASGNPGNSINAISRVIEGEKGKTVTISVNPATAKVGEEITVTGTTNRPNTACRAEYNIGSGWVTAREVKFDNAGKAEVRFYSPIAVTASGRARCGSVYSNELTIKIE